MMRDVRVFRVPEGAEISYVMLECRRHNQQVLATDWGHHMHVGHGMPAPPQPVGDLEIFPLCPCGYRSECGMHCGAGHTSGECPPWPAATD